MQRSLVTTALITAVVFGVGGWFLASKTEKLKPPRPNPKHEKCTTGDCNVKVELLCTTPSNPTRDTCTVYTVPDVIFIKPGDKIKFTLNSPAGHPVKFDPAEGIKFGSSKFTCTPNGNDQKFKCENTLTGADPVDAHYYSVNVTGFDIVDPWAVNY